MVIILTQEIKQDILYWRINLPLYAYHVIDSQRIKARYDTVLHRLCPSVPWIEQMSSNYSVTMLSSRNQSQLE